MKRRILKHRRLLFAGAFLAGALVIDQGLGFLLQKALPRVKVGQTVGQVNVALDHAGADVLIFGSSRAQHHIMPAVLTDEFGCSAFNAGCDGQGILYHRILARLAIARGSNARLFILNVDPSDFYKPEFPRALVLAPYLEEDPLARELVARAAEPYGELKTHCRTWRFNSIALPIALRMFASNPEPACDGFVPFSGDYREVEFRHTKADFHEEVVQQQRQFIADARSHGIAVALVVGPRFRRDPHYAKGLDAIARLAREEDVCVLYLDDRRYPVFCNKAYYRDHAHLNAEGAMILTHLIASELRERKLLP
ncbi:MAG: hypothetical protein HQ567_13735 [Candidatus Nealsonbacteria bacterium]|nr:hypothetical protein [Candidatus Nealsonbacteria bacterium]